MRGREADENGRDIRLEQKPSEGNSRLDRASFPHPFFTLVTLTKKAKSASLCPQEWRQRILMSVLEKCAHFYSSRHPSPSLLSPLSLGLSWLARSNAIDARSHTCGRRPRWPE